MDLKVFRYSFPIDFQARDKKWLFVFLMIGEKSMCISYVLYYFTDYNFDITNAKWLYTYEFFP